MGQIDLFTARIHHDEAPRGIRLVGIEEDLLARGPLSATACRNNVRSRISPKGKALQLWLYPLEPVLTFRIGDEILRALLREVVREVEALIPHPVLAHFVVEEHPRIPAHRILPGLILYEDRVAHVFDHSRGSPPKFPAILYEV